MQNEVKQKTQTLFNLSSDQQTLKNSKWIDWRTIFSNESTDQHEINHHSCFFPLFFLTEQLSAIRCYSSSLASTAESYANEIKTYFFLTWAIMTCFCVTRKKMEKSVGFKNTGPSIMSLIMLLACVSLLPLKPSHLLTLVFSHATGYPLQIQALCNVTPSFDPFDSTQARLRVGFRAAFPSFQPSQFASWTSQQTQWTRRMTLKLRAWKEDFQLPTFFTVKLQLSFSFLHKWQLLCECLILLFNHNVCVVLACNSRSVQPAKQPPHWAQDSLWGSVLPAHSHLPVKKPADTMNDPRERKCVLVCVHGE